jgi:osmotically-inducible protein OsmY
MKRRTPLAAALAAAAVLRAAETAARGVSGVLSVKNEIAVRP